MIPATSRFAVWFVTALVVMFAIATALVAVLDHEYWRTPADEVAVLHWVAEMEGTVVREGPDHHIVTINLSDTPVCDADLQRLASVSQLRSLNLARTSISDRGMRHIGALRGISALDLSETCVSDAGLRELNELRGLKWIDLSGTEVTMAGIRRLELPELQIVAVDGMPCPTSPAFEVTEGGKVQGTE